MAANNSTVSPVSTALLRRPVLPAECRPTYVRHFSYAMLDAVAVGILTNAPLMALMGLKSQAWQLAIQLPISGVGMLAVLYLGGFMAGRSPMPFAFRPGIAYAVSSLLMALSSQPVPFLILAGLGTLFETVSRPAVTAIIRLNYPAQNRGAVTGRIRQWHLLVALAVSALAAWGLDAAREHQSWMIKGQMVLAGLASAAGFLVFRTIQVNPGPTLAAQREPGAKGEGVSAERDGGHLASRAAGGDSPRPLPQDQSRVGSSPGAGAAASQGRMLGPFVEAWHIWQSDRRFRYYLQLGFLYAFGTLLYSAYIPVLFNRQLHCGYLLSSFLANTLPNLLAILCTGPIGNWIDRVSTWKAWSVIRLGWGLDALALAAASALAAWQPALAVSLGAAGRVSRGLVMGGSWILWWQVGINHFARPGADTTRYMGMLIFINGLARILGPLTGAGLLAGGCSLGLILLAGGGSVLISALLSFGQFLRERTDARYATMASFEERAVP